jgi:alkylation response protein AidB-like acyl-CoA dehydrogenase
VSLPFDTHDLPPLLGQAFPPPGLRPDEKRALAVLQQVLDTEIAARAAENDAKGRYPLDSIAALKTTGILASAIPKALGGLGFSHRASMEAQLRIAAADSAVAQIFKIHEEVVRDILSFAPDENRPAFLKSILEERKILGLAVAENGRTVNEPMSTLFVPSADGGATVNGRKIYTTGAAGADIIVVWSFDPTDPGIAENPGLGLRVSLVPASTPGITIHRDWDALGQRATDSGTITFTDLRIDPSWNGRVRDRLPPLHAPLRWQLGFAAILIGNAVGALRAAVPFINERSRPWPSAGVDNAADDPYVRRLAGELTADIAAAYTLTLSSAELLDRFERGEADRTAVAIPVYAAKSAASRAALRATSEIFTLMGTRSAAAGNGFDRYWRNARTLSLHDPVEWKNGEIGQHVLTGWSPPWGIYQ